MKNVYFYTSSPFYSCDISQISQFEAFDGKKPVFENDEFVDSFCLFSNLCVVLYQLSSK